MGFFEAYDEATAEPDDCAGLLMNNGGFLWGLFEGVLGVEIRGDDLRLRASVPKRILPARARIHYRGADLELHRQSGRRSSAIRDNTPIPVSRTGHYRFNLAPKTKPTYRVEIIQGADVG